jgi:hypothetical protein
MIVCMTIRRLSFASTLHLAVETIHRAAVSLVSVAFKLNGRVTDAIPLTQYGFERVQDRRALARWEISDGGVAGEGVHVIGDAPHMQIMHILYPWHTHHIPHQLSEINIFRSGL